MQLRCQTRKMPKFIIKDIEIYSDESEKKDSDEKNSDEESSNEENSNKEN